MSEINPRLTAERTEAVYERLVDETENPLTIHDRSNNARLHDLLELLEYLIGNEDTNPLDTWFSNERTL